MLGFLPDHLVLVGAMPHLHLPPHWFVEAVAAITARIAILQ
jgi:hypothetical protein